MAKVVCKAHNHGAEPVVRTVGVHYKGQTPLQLLKKKAASAVNHGWTVEWLSKSSFHAWKEYPDNEGDPNEPARKDRWYEIR